MVAQAAPLDPDNSMTVVDRERQGVDSRIGEGATIINSLYRCT
jgi:hypothetical protein